MTRTLLGPLCLGLSLACQSTGAASPPPAPPVSAAPLADAGPQRLVRSSYVLEIDAPTVAVGAEGKLRLRMRANAGWHVNKEFPTSLVVEAPAGVEVKQPKQSAADATTKSEMELVFEVAFVAREAGAKQLPATFKFAVCTDKSCEPQREKLQLAITAR